MGMGMGMGGDFGMGAGMGAFGAGPGMQNAFGAGAGAGVEGGFSGGAAAGFAKAAPNGPRSKETDAVALGQLAAAPPENAVAARGKMTQVGDKWVFQPHAQV